MQGFDLGRGPVVVPGDAQPAPKQLNAANGLAAVAAANAAAGGCPARSDRWYWPITSAATASATGAAAATTVRLPACSSVATSPSGSSPGRIEIRPTSHADSTTCCGTAS